MLQEGDQGRVDGDNLLGRHVHEVHFGGRVQHRVALLAGQDALFRKGAVRVQRGVRLGDHVAVLDIGGHVHHVVGDTAIHHPAVGRLDEAEVIHLRVTAQTGNQADVGAFGRLDGADAPVVRAVYVAHVEARALAGEAARPQRRDAALVTQVGERIGLVFELRELAAAEELAHRRYDGAVVHQLGGGRRIGVPQQHALAHAPRHAAHAHAELVGEQLAHRADAAVAEVVDVVFRDRHLDGHAVFVRSHRDRFQALLKRHQVTDSVDQARIPKAAVFKGQQGPFLAPSAQLGVHLEAARLAQVVALGVGEQSVEVLNRLVALGRIAGAQHREEAQQGLVGIHARALVLGEFGCGVKLSEKGLQLGVVIAQHAQQQAHRELALVDLHLQHAAIELQFNPGAALGHGDDGCRVHLLDALVGGREVHAGRAVNLADHHAVRPVDHKGAIIRHQRQIAQKHLVFLDQATVLMDQLELGIQRRLVGQILFTALFRRIGRFAQAVFQKVQHQPSRAALLGLVNRKNFAEGTLQSGVVALVGRLIGLQERLEGVHLHFGQVGQRDHFGDLTKTLNAWLLIGKAHAHLALPRSCSCGLPGR